MERTLFFLSAATGSYIGENANLAALSGEGNYEIVFTPDFHTYDGRYNNNGWLQEAPDPITKLTWDNAALISPETAKALGVRNYEAEGDIIEISLENGGTIEAPVLVAPGHADRSISISLGYGRSVTGRVGVGTGCNVYPLRTSQAPYFAFTRSVKPTGRRGALAITQERGQPIALLASAADRGGAVGHGDRSEHVHGLQRVRHSVPGGE
jgi:molybdopterin-containing oxidoreductase family iron-sulfur binding subunit